MSSATKNTISPLARKRPEIDLDHFGTYLIGKLTQARQDKIEGLGEEMNLLEKETRPKILPADITAEEAETLIEAGHDVRLYAESTPEEREQDQERAKAAVDVFDRRNIEIICEQIETMLLTRDPNTQALVPAADLADKLIAAYRDPEVSEENAIGLDDLTEVLDAVMGAVDVEKRRGN